MRNVDRPCQLAPAVGKRLEPTQPCLPSETPWGVLACDAQRTDGVDVVHLIVKEDHVLEGDPGYLVQALQCV